MFSGIDFSAVTVGAGGREGYDGWPAEGPTSGLGQVRYPDFEMMELVWPVRYLQHEQIMDSEGAGEWVGSWAHMYQLQWLTDCSAVLMGQGVRDFSSPFGLFGGADGKPNRETVHRTDGNTEDIDCGSYFQYKANDWKEQYIQGGAGFGKPYQRELEMVQRNVRDELVSIERARKVYGVAINPVTLEVDIETTRKLREKQFKADSPR